MRSLRDLEREHDAGDLDETDYRELRDGYTARLAALVRATESSAALSPPRRPRVALGLAVVAFAVIAGFVVSRVASTRLPGQTVTGGISSSVVSVLAEARALESTKPDEAVKRYIDVLKIEPDNVEALTYRGWLLRNIGKANNVPSFLDEARTSLDRAIAVDPSYPDARVFRGVIAWRDDHDAKVAETQFDAFFALPQPPAGFADLVRSVDAEARSSLGLPVRAGSESLGPTSTSAG
jgi:tetratricopeptide (TPR) repeat protein